MRVIYDIETHPNIFTLAIEHADAPFRWFFEISDRRNDSKQIIDFVSYLNEQNAEMIGFNNIGFDYPVLHQLLRMGHSNALTLYKKAQAIIDSDFDKRFVHMVYPSDRYVKQLDLYKIHHFDNKSRMTSLKILEFNMKLNNISDLPFNPGTSLNHDEMDVLGQYNFDDVDATKKFYKESIDKIAFRKELSIKYDRDFMNHNDTKIGKDYFQMELERQGVQCYDYGTKGRTPRQTIRPVINLNDAILPWIRFETPEFTRVMDWLKSQKIKETKGVFKGLIAKVKGFNFVFGVGGIHGSVDSQVIESDDENIIIDLDVASYYPNLAIASNFYPEHLGEKFCEIYKNLYEMRKKYPKGTTENTMLKLALNGTYGDSNNKFSVFYDPLFTMKITLNGQLLLCKLVEYLMHVDDLNLIQINTDGVTIKVKRDYLSQVKDVSELWERETGLQLEQVAYSRMFIRDVNNYIAEYENGKLKRKGAYEYNLDWHQNASSLVVPKVTEKVLIEGAPIRETVINWVDKYDFMLRTKVPRSGFLALGDKQIQNVSRYYVAHGKESLWKWLPPLKNKTEWRKFAIQSGRTVQVCNNIEDSEVLPIDYDYYVNEIEKLVLGLQ